MSFDENEKRRKQFFDAAENAKKVLKKGDKIRVTKCPGTKRTITFSHFDGNWIVSKSGINDYSARSIDRLNGFPINFCKDE